MHTCVKVDPKALDTFVYDYYQRDLPDGSVSEILQMAFNALIKADVLRHADGTSLKAATIKVHGGLVSLDEPGKKTVWENRWSFEASPKANGFPPLAGLVEALAYALAAILNSPPTNDPGRPWPKH
jgi:hypothetical protein